MPEWPYPDEPRQANQFGYRSRGVDRDDALRLLGEEIDRIRGFDVQIGVVTPADNISLAGTMRKQAFLSTGVEVSFMAGDRQLVFYTNAFREVNANLYAIGRGLEALRKLERYGITQANQQYEGFAQLDSGHVVDAERGRVLADQAGGLRKALRQHHPDQGGSERDFKDVMAYKTAIGA
jgi:hypothetical protein